jgi:chromosome segregation protein
MLMEQVSLQDDELSGLKKELGDRDQQIAVMGQNFNQATLALQELRDACSAVNDEKLRCEQQLQQYAARLAQMESEKDGVVKKLDAVKCDETTLQSQLLDYENLLENVKLNAERKDESFAARYQNVCARLRELNSLVDDRSKRVEALEDQLRATTSELDSVRQDCEGMLQVMTSMEKQLTQYCAREDAVAEVSLL